jgi:hypothetical protein
MEVRTGESLSISELNGQNGSERKTIPASTYEAEYRGMKVQMEKTKPEWGVNGQRKVVRLLFKIVKGPSKGSITSYKGGMFANNDGTWVVGSKSKLAEAMKIITGGKPTLDDTCIGKLFFVNVTNNKAKKPEADGVTYRVFDQVETFLAKPVDDSAPTAIVAAATPAPATAAPATAAPANAASNPGLLDDLTSLADFA